MTNDERMIYVPLGGAGEIGMNMYVYGYGPQDEERFIVVDMGIGFPDGNDVPGVKLEIANPQFLVDRADRIDGIFFTHAHEDHIGAVAHMLELFKAPIYAPKFTRLMVEQKLTSQKLKGFDFVDIKPYPEMVEVGPFKVGFVPVPHSIVDAFGLLIETPTARVFHTGDFKVDDAPGLGAPFDEKMFREIGDLGVTALVCDSTNIFEVEEGHSELELEEPLEALMKASSGLVVATTFGSHLPRIRTLARAAKAAGRTTGIIGWSMKNRLKLLKRSGLKSDIPAIAMDVNYTKLNRSKKLLIVTGSQGEATATSKKLAFGEFTQLSMEPGDTFLFSSKTIPGNELAVSNIKNKLSQMGVHVFDDSMGLFHASGHANRPGIEKMHELIRPSLVVPMHGEYRHLREHAELAEYNGRRGAIIPNGTIFKIDENEPEILGTVEVDRIFTDGNMLVHQTDGGLIERNHAASSGVVAVSVSIYQDDLSVGDVWVKTLGLPIEIMESGNIPERLEGLLIQTIEEVGSDVVGSDEKLENIVQSTTQKFFTKEIGKRPAILVFLNRLEN